MNPETLDVESALWYSGFTPGLTVTKDATKKLLDAPNVNSYATSENTFGIIVRLTDGTEVLYDKDAKLSFDASGNLEVPKTLRAPTELIEGVAELFEISGNDFVAESHCQAWKYTGPLEDLQEWFLEEFPATEIIEKASGIVKIVTDGQTRKSSGPGSRTFEVFSFADDLETAWRIHLGETIVEESEPYSVLAGDGQSLTELKALLREFDKDLADHMSPSNDAEQELLERWKIEVALGREFVGFRHWVRVLSSRELFGDSDSTATAQTLAPPPPTFPDVSDPGPVRTQIPSAFGGSSYGAAPEPLEAEDEVDIWGGLPGPGDAPAPLSNRALADKFLGKLVDDTYARWEDGRG